MNASPAFPIAREATAPRRGRVWQALAGALVSAMLAGGCASLPPPPDKPATTAISPAQAAQTRLGRALAEPARARPKLTGLVPLPDGSDAFDARLRLVDLAERTVDLQTYIYKPDAAGLAMAERLLAAAGRGVRVRLLIDDNGTAGLDPLIALFDAHPSIEVRLFNPFANRSMRLPELVRDLQRLNSRMHVKSMIVDGQVAIMGGRNIGDAYADGANVNFTDLDMLAVGAVLPRAGVAFDRYWNSPQAYPASVLVRPERAWREEDLRAARERLAATAAAAAAGSGAPPAAAPPVAGTRAAGPGAGVATTAGAGSPASETMPARASAGQIVEEMAAGRLNATWAPTALWTDDPDLENLDPDDPLPATGRLAPRLTQAFAAAGSQLDVVSPYFVPDAETRALLQALAKRGVRVRVLTNSLAATDVAAVHSGYRRYRTEMLQAGIALYELRPVPVPQATGRRFGFGGSMGGSSQASLHAKAFAVDRQRLYVGSFNLDPRSTRHNDELVMAMASPALASQLSDTLDRSLDAIAWRVALAPDGTLQWHHDGRVEVSEPAAGLGRRALVEVLSLFDIEWLL